MAKFISNQFNVNMEKNIVYRSVFVSFDATITEFRTTFITRDQLSWPIPCKAVITACAIHGIIICTRNKRIQIKNHTT